MKVITNVNEIEVGDILEIISNYDRELGLQIIQILDIYKNSKNIKEYFKVKVLRSYGRKRMNEDTIQKLAIINHNFIYEKGEDRYSTRYEVRKLDESEYGQLLVENI